MVAGRADGAEGPLNLARRHAAHRVHHRARRPHGRVQAAGGHGGVRIERPQALCRRGGENQIDKRCRVHTFQVGALGQGGCAAIQHHAAVVQSAQHRRQPLGALGVAGAVVVGRHIGVGEQSQTHRRHCPIPPRPAKAGFRRLRERYRL